MRVLLISDYATPTGGAEHVMLGLRSALRERGHDARLLSSTARPLGRASLADYHCFGMLSKLRGLSQIWNPSAYLQLQSILDEFRPDIVHVRLFLSQISPSILPLLRDVPTIFHAAWYRTICPLGTKMLPDGRDCESTAGFACVKQGCIPALALPSVTAQMWLTKRGWGSFNAVVANSDATSRRLMASGVAVDEVIWNGVKPGPSGRPHPTSPTVAFAGRLVWEKGADVLLEAFHRVQERIPEARLLIAGDGPERPRLEAMATQLGLDPQVTFLGMLPQEEMEAHFREAWVQVVPSRWQEPFGLVAAEALMRGTPAIVTNSGGLAEFVQDGITGLHCPAGDSPKLAKALGDLLSDPERVRTMGARARSFALEHLDQRIFVNRFLALYERLLDSREAVEQDEALWQTTESKI